MKTPESPYRHTLNIREGHIASEAPNKAELIVSVLVDDNSLTITNGEFKVVKVPFSYFKSKDDYDFTDVEVVEYGTGLRIGQYEYDSREILEIDHVILFSPI